VGQPDQFAKDTFAEETPLITQGAMSWQDPPELRLVKLLKVQGDGLLRVHRPELLVGLSAPWSQGRGHLEILLEIKMAGDLLDKPSVQRAVLRRQAVARSGDALDEFARWVAPRRPVDWVLSMIEYTSMSTTVRDELVRKFGKSDDPVIEARRQRILQVLLEESPQVREELIQKGREEGRLLEARTALRGVLAQRGLMLTPEQDARIEQCADFTTLRRWMMRAISAAMISEVLE
jgi:hypothetical protein